MADKKKAVEDSNQQVDAGAQSVVQKKSKKKGGSLGLWILIALTASAMWWLQYTTV